MLNEAKHLKSRPKDTEAKINANARGYEAETEAKILAWRPVWPRVFNNSARLSEKWTLGQLGRYQNNDTSK